MSSTPKRQFAIPIPGKPEMFLVCVGGIVNERGTCFSQLRVYLADSPKNYRQGKLLIRNASGDKCSYTRTWELTTSTHLALGDYQSLLRNYVINHNGIA